MPALSIQPTYPIFTDIDGQPLENGYIWIGIANLDPQTNPINVYWDDALTQLAAQPIRTRGGYPVNAGTPARLYVNSDYSIRVTNKNGAAIYNAPEATERISNAIISQIDSSLVNYTPAGTGAVSTTVQSKLRDTVSVKDFGAHSITEPGYENFDSAAAIQKAIDYAYTFSISQTVFDEYGWQSRGGLTVTLPAGKYLISESIVLRPNVSLKGDGKSSTCIYSTIDASFFIAAAPTKSGEYGLAGISVYDLMVLGNKTGLYQRAFELLRPVGMKMTGVVINSVGGAGMILRETSNSTFIDIEIANCGSNGLVITHGDSATYPSNANTFISPRIMFNDGDGILLTGGVNGNTFIGGSVERNGYSVGGVGHYNINDGSSCYQPNHFIDVWTEGPVAAHIYINHPNAGDKTRITGWKHFGDGASVLPERALIVNSGVVFCDNPTGSSVSYKTVAGSNAPFRINKTSSFLVLTNPTGSTVSGTGFVEDFAGAKTGLYSCLRQSNLGEFNAMSYGPQTFFNDFGGGDGVAYRNDTEAYPWYQSRAFYKDIVLGPGGSAPDAGFTRVDYKQLGPRAGDFFNVGGAWNGSHLMMGAYHMWVDSTGKLRIKSGAPASDTDGTVVGTQA